MEENVNFIGNGKEVGQKIQISLRWYDLKKIRRWSNKKGHQFITLDIIKRKSISDWGHTHAVAEHKMPPPQNNHKQNRN